MARIRATGWVAIAVTCTALFFPRTVKGADCKPKEPPRPVAGAGEVQKICRKYAPVFKTQEDENCGLKCPLADQGWGLTEQQHLDACLALGNTGAGPATIELNQKNWCDNRNNALTKARAEENAKARCTQQDFRNWSAFPQMFPHIYRIFQKCGKSLQGQGPENPKCAELRKQRDALLPRAQALSERINALQAAGNAALSIARHWQGALKTLPTVTSMPQARAFIKTHYGQAANLYGAYSEALQRLGQAEAAKREGDMAAKLSAYANEIEAKRPTRDGVGKFISGEFRRVKAIVEKFRPAVDSRKKELAANTAQRKKFDQELEDLKCGS